MIIDSSAIIAVLYNEKDAGCYAQAMEEAEICRLSAATFVEVSIVADAQVKGDELDKLIRRVGIIIEPLSAEQADIARQAYADYGRGNHKAKLNFGDCFSYALAKDLGEPLLFKGEDFGQTDVISAI